jgi:hypothetical protein
MTRCVTIPSFPRSLLVTSLIGLTFLPIAQFLPRCLFSKRYHCSVLKAARPNRFPGRVPLVQVLAIIQSFFFFSKRRAKIIPSDRCSHISGSYANIASRLFSRTGWGRPLHKVQFPTFRIVIEVPIICFAIFNPKISYNFLSVLPLPRCDRSPELPLMPFTVVFSVHKI